MSTSSRSNGSSCPSRAELDSFARGQLGAEAFERVAAHLEGCDHCPAELTDGNDALLSELGGLPGPVETDVVPEELMRAAQQGSGSSRKLVVDRGQELAHALQEGPVQLAHFELHEELGVGSFGYVFRARDLRLDRIVAIKVQRAGSLDHPQDRERFHREARSAAQLEHPGIVSLYETGETDEGISYLVTEFVDGQTLEDLIRSGHFKPKEAASVVAELARALEYAHGQGVIHRDLKPSNVMVDGAGQCHLMDFGLAKREAGEVTFTPHGEVMGTPAYMSPEQARGDSHGVDARSDIYSLGAILYELVTGERPFQGNRRMLLLQVLEEEPRPPSRLNEKTPRDLETICLKALAKSPGRRYDSAGALADDLERFGRGEPILARPLGPIARTWRWGRRNPVAASLFLASTIGFAAGIIYLLQLTETLVSQTALSSVEMQSVMLEEVNDLYSDIVTEARGREDPHLPLPATFTIDLGKEISSHESGMRVKLYSDYPFPPRTRVLTDFERDALAALRANPGVPYHRFVELDGKPVLRFATARLMQKSCLRCHNHMSASPKRDWSEGDVRGVLEIIRPLDRDIARTQRGLRGAFVLVGGISTFLLIVTVLILRRRPAGASPRRRS